MEILDGEIVEDAPENLRAVNGPAILQPPIYLDFGPQVDGFGGFAGADGKCSPLTYAALGAVAMYALPPLLGGFFSGIRQGWRDRD